MSDIAGYGNYSYQNYYSANYASGASGASNISGCSGLSGSSGCSGSSNCSGVSGSSGYTVINKLPDNLRELLVKYQSEVLTKNEILDVINQLKIKPEISENKIVFQCNGKKYSLTYSLESTGLLKDTSNNNIQSVSKTSNQNNSDFHYTTSLKEEDVNNWDALQKSIKDMNLRETYCRGVYCQKHNPDMLPGDYTHQKHFVWNDATQEFIELSNIYYLSADGNQAENLYGYEEILAYQQGYKFTDINGMYEKDGKYYRLNNITKEFYYVETEVVEETTVDPELVAKYDAIGNDFAHGKYTVEELKAELEKIGACVDFETVEKYGFMNVTFQNGNYLGNMSCNTEILLDDEESLNRAIAEHEQDIKNRVRGGVNPQFSAKYKALGHDFANGKYTVEELKAKLEELGDCWNFRTIEEDGYLHVRFQNMGYFGHMFCNLDDLRKSNNS